YGRAQKAQVQQMVTSFFNLKQVPKPDDVADALAVAICHAHANKLEKTLKNIGGKYV
ncbi:crossover junction endodeoxyribonuclease RuvC, partial [Clostridium tertium]